MFAVAYPSSRAFYCHLCSISQSWTILHCQRIRCITVQYIWYSCDLWVPLARAFPDLCLFHPLWLIVVVHPEWKHSIYPHLHLSSFFLVTNNLPRIMMPCHIYLSIHTLPVSWMSLTSWMRFKLIKVTHLCVPVEYRRTQPVAAVVRGCYPSPSHSIHALPWGITVPACGAWPSSLGLKIM